ncbi:hypothetical protein DU504_16120 [Haloplanus salinus]|uniref:Uncharacterized protein n=1 Tax=Haloplanus salinus TaxID=1126245 RepID=A0A368N3X9_9EURY|nr:hypothetical protein DU504_16120 [Haloplanus salinus]
MSQPMYDRYSDFEELRPTDEASHIPDTMLDDRYESDLLAATRRDEHWWMAGPTASRRCTGIRTGTPGASSGISHS